MSNVLARIAARDLKDSIMMAGNGVVIPCGGSVFKCEVFLGAFYQEFGIIGSDGESIIKVLNECTLLSPIASNDMEKITLANRVIKAINAKIDADKEARRKASRAAAEKCGLL